MRKISRQTWVRRSDQTMLVVDYTHRTLDIYQVIDGECVRMICRSEREQVAPDDATIGYGPKHVPFNAFHGTPEEAHAVLSDAGFKMTREAR